jgi:hypothetical protein
MLPETGRIVVAIMTEALEESFLLDEFETGVIENVAAVPIFVAKPCPRGKFLTVQKLDKQLLFELVRSHGYDFGRCINNTQ